MGLFYKAHLIIQTSNSLLLERLSCLSLSILIVSIFSCHGQLNYQAITHIINLYTEVKKEQQIQLHTLDIFFLILIKKVLACSRQNLECIHQAYCEDYFDKALSMALYRSSRVQV